MEGIFIDGSKSSKTILTLIPRCREWNIEILSLYANYTGKDLTALGTDRIGHIGRVHLLQLDENNQLVVKLDELKKVWEKAETLCIHDADVEPTLEIGGGMGLDPETDWQTFLTHLDQLTG